MTSYRPIDSKREEFRKYLERCGVMDALTKVLVMLYEEAEKPEDALEFVRVNLGDTRPTVSEMEALQTELSSALERVRILEEENCNLKKKLSNTDDEVVSIEEPIAADVEEPGTTTPDLNGPGE